MADQAEQLMMAGLPEPQEVSTERPRGVHQFRCYRQDQLFLPMDFPHMIAHHTAGEKWDHTAREPLPCLGSWWARTGSNRGPAD